MAPSRSHKTTSDLNPPTPSSDHLTSDAVAAAIEGGRIPTAALCTIHIDNYWDSERFESLFRYGVDTISHVAVSDWCQFGGLDLQELYTNPESATTAAGNEPSRALVSSSLAQYELLAQRNRPAAVDEEDSNDPFLVSGAINPRYGINPHIPRERPTVVLSSIKTDQPAPSPAAPARARRFKSRLSLPGNPVKDDVDDVLMDSGSKRKSVSWVGSGSGMADLMVTGNGSKHSDAKSFESAPLSTQSIQLVVPDRKHGRIWRLPLVADSESSRGNEDKLGWAERPLQQDALTVLSTYPTRSLPYQTSDTQGGVFFRSADDNSQGRRVTLSPDTKRVHQHSRNRVASSRCRQRKKDWQAELEQQYQHLSAQRMALRESGKTLTQELLSLKELCLGHRNCECSQIRMYLQTLPPKFVPI